MRDNEHVSYNCPNDDSIIVLSDDDDNDGIQKEITASTQSSRASDLRHRVMDKNTNPVGRIISNRHTYNAKDGQSESYFINKLNVNRIVNRPILKINASGNLKSNLKPVAACTATIIDIIDLEQNKTTRKNSNKQNEIDQNTDVIAVNRIVHRVPVNLPIKSRLTYPLLKNGQMIYAEFNSLQPWLICKVKRTITKDFTLIMLQSVEKLLTTQLVAYFQPCPVQYYIGTRVIAKLKHMNSRIINDFHPGIIAEIPKLLNKFRYMIFFDNGSVRYRYHADIRLIANNMKQLPNHVHPDHKNFIRHYFSHYPDRRMLRLTQNRFLRAKHNDLWQLTKVLEVDASLVKLYFTAMKHSDWVYRGSFNLYEIFEKCEVKNINSVSVKPKCKQNAKLTKADKNPTVVSRRNVARKSTNKLPAASTSREITEMSVVNGRGTEMESERNAEVNERNNGRFLCSLPKNLPGPKPFVIHNCNRSCVNWTAYHYYRTSQMNVLAIPLHFGFKRRSVTRFTGHRRCKRVVYKTPCGRVIRNMEKMYHYLVATESQMTIDYFDFNRRVNPLASYKPSDVRTFVSDISAGKEFKPISCVNDISDQEPPPIEYVTTRQTTSGVNLNVDNNFLCGCDCTDNCVDKSKCACWKMTIVEGQRYLPNGRKSPIVGYEYRRLFDSVFTGIYECNSTCSCSSSCVNRVVQNPITQKLQLFRTKMKGWGVRCLNDISRGSFVCNYVGNLLTEADAYEECKNDGDEYLAELDYIETVEKYKENYENDVVPDSPIIECDRRTAGDDERSVVTPNLLANSFRDALKDNNFLTISSIALHLGKRRNLLTDTTTIHRKSARSKSKLDACHVQNDDDASSKSLRKYFGNNETAYIMDSKTSGNIGRYFNHSCCPNIFVQNVFVETHDPRFPCISFFALNNIRAGTELTWDYSYIIGSVPGKILECHCNSVNCKGRLL